MRNAKTDEIIILIPLITVIMWAIIVNFIFNEIFFNYLNN